MASEPDETLGQCPVCLNLYRPDDGRCHHCARRARDVSAALRHARVRMLPSADPARPGTKLATVGPVDLYRPDRGYWVALGPVPLTVAIALYADPAGRDVIRVAGHCLCPPPADWLTWRRPNGRAVLDLANRVEAERYVRENPNGLMAESALRILESHDFSDDPESLGATASVDLYHIDGDLGLRVFVDTLARFGLYEPFSPEVPHA